MVYSNSHDVCVCVCVQIMLNLNDCTFQSIYGCGHMSFLTAKPIIEGPATTVFGVGVLFPGLNERKLLVKKFIGGLCCQNFYSVCVCACV